MILFCIFEGVRYFWVKLCVFFTKLLSDTNQKFFLRHWNRYRTGTLKPYSTPLWTISFSSVTYIKLWWSVKNLQNNALKILGGTFHCKHTYIRKFFSFLIVFPALIDNPNNFEINRLIRLVLSGMFALRYSTLLMSFSSFSLFVLFFLHFLETLSKMGTL